MPDNTDRPPTLLERTRTLLTEDPRDLLEVHKQSGLPFHWLRKVKAGETKEPGVNRIQALYEFLTNSTLQLQ